MLQTQIHGEVIALSIEKGTYYGLNAVGSRIWALMAEAIRVDAICDTLVREFEVDRVVCEEQVLDLLRELHEEGMIELSEEARRGEP